MAWHNLGAALRDAGRVAEAFEAYETALEIYREFEDWYWAGQALEGLAFAHETADHVDEARAYRLRAAEAFTRAEAAGANPPQTH
nr:tetratricopeptide repeat protein [Streptomyces cupreus]